MQNTYHAQAEKQGARRAPDPPAAATAPSEAMAASATVALQRARINPHALSPTGVLALQRAVGNRAASRLLQPPVSLMRTPAPDAHPSAGRIAAIQRLPGMFSTHSGIAKNVEARHNARQAAASGPSLSPAEKYAQVTQALAREQELRAQGASESELDAVLMTIPEEYRPRRVTPSEKAVKANKQQFLEEAVQERAQQQRKAADIQVIRKLKADLGRDMATLAKDDPQRAALKAQLAVIDDIEVKAAAKMDPAKLAGKLDYAKKKSTLKAELAALPKGSDNRKAEIKATLGDLANNKPSKVAERLERAYKDKKGADGQALDEGTRSMLKDALAAVKNGGRNLSHAKKLALIDLCVTVLGSKAPRPMTLHNMLTMPGKNADEWVKKLKDENADKAGTALDAASKVTEAGAVTARGAKVIASETGNEAVGGASHFADGRKVIDSTGSAQQGGDILGTVSALTSIGSQLTEFASLAKAVKDGDPAEQAAATDKIVDGAQSLAASLIQLGKEAALLAGDFGGAGLATEMAATALPALDIAAGTLNLIKHGTDLYAASKRVKGQGARINKASAAGAAHMALAIGQFKLRGAELIAHNSVALAADSLTIIGGAITLSGIGAVVGQPIKYAGMVVSLVNKAGLALRDAYMTGKSQEARAADMLALPGSAEKLMRHDPKHGVQVLIREARVGNTVAVAELKSYGVNDRMLAESADKSLRELMLNQLKLKEDAETASEQVKGGYEAAKDWWHEDTGYQVDVLVKVKNKLNYGGKKDRGMAWKIKARLGGDVVESTADVHKILVAMSDDERKALGITQEEVLATRTQLEREMSQRR